MNIIARLGYYDCEPLQLCVSIIPMGPDVQGIVSRFGFQNRLAYDADNSQFLH